jgi:hypothetical protein
VHLHGSIDMTWQSAVGKLVHADFLVLIAVFDMVAAENVRFSATGN